MAVNNIWKKFGTQTESANGFFGYPTLVESIKNMSIKSIAGYGISAATAIISNSLTGMGAQQLKSMLDGVNNQPSLAYVPIQSESFVMHRQVDIGNTMLIAQVDQKKDYVTDNAAPRPRTWTIQGYITSLAPLMETGVLTKPTLQLQQATLDAASESRQTVVLKTDTGEMVDVLIQDLQIGSTPKGTNVKTISATVQEVKVMTNTMLDDIILDSTQAASVALNSIVSAGAISTVMDTVVTNGTKITSWILSKIPKK